jgi:hypothetical protein
VRRVESRIASSPTSESCKRAVDAVVYGPIGFLSYLRDTAPSLVQVFVTRGRKELGDLRSSVDSRIASVAPDGDRDTALANLRARVAQVVTQAGDVMVSAVEVVASLRPEAKPAARPTDERATPRSATSDEEPNTPAGSPAASTTPVVALVPEPGLAIADYDGLSAQQVVAHLDGLDRSDLERIREYEAAHRGRRTIISKIDQLLG